MFLILLGKIYFYTKYTKPTFFFFFFLSLESERDLDDPEDFDLLRDRDLSLRRLLVSLRSWT